MRPWGLVVGKNPFISQIRLSAARAIPALSDAALLAGRIDPASAPQRVLSSLQERLLWEQVIADLAENAINQDPDYTVRAWMGVLTYMLSDYKFLHE